MRIKLLRQAAGLSQFDLGASVGVGQTTVSMWETEAALPRVRDLPLLARVLGVPIGELFQDTDAPDMTNHITELGA